MAADFDGGSVLPRATDLVDKFGRFTIERLPQPIDVLAGGTGELESLDLNGRHVQGAEAAVCGLDFDEIHHRKVVAELLIAPEALSEQRSGRLRMAQ